MPKSITIIPHPNRFPKACNRMAYKWLSPTTHHNTPCVNIYHFHSFELIFITFCAVTVPWISFVADPFAGRNGRQPTTTVSYCLIPLSSKFNNRFYFNSRSLLCDDDCCGTVCFLCREDPLIALVRFRTSCPTFYISFAFERIENATKKRTIHPKRTGSAGMGKIYILGMVLCDICPCEFLGCVTYFQ